MNYDYDSEAEWEEEDPEGEDIIVSDNEDDAEGDELVYDDFFRPDNELEDIEGDVNINEGNLLTPSIPICKLLLSFLLLFLILFS